MTRQPLTVGQLIEGLVKCDDHRAIPEFTLDGENYFHVFAVDGGVDAITLDVEPVRWFRVGGEADRGEG